MARKPLPQDEVGERVRIGATLRALRGDRPLDEVSRILVRHRVIASRPYLANIEAGRKRLTPDLAQALALVYDVPLSAIVHPNYYTDAA